MLKNCPNCGCILQETTWGRKFCPNCGIIEEDKEESIEYSNYIG
jgi:uncharacterized Zn finger protein (UPF0148 family)